MKMLALVLSLMIGQAFAGSVDVLNVKHDFRNADAKSSFFIKYGTSDVKILTQVEEQMQYGDQHYVTNYHYSTLPGLNFDSNSNEITYTADNGETVVCAKVVQRGVSVFRHNRVYNQDCRFKIKTSFDTVKVRLEY